MLRARIPILILIFFMIDLAVGLAYIFNYLVGPDTRFEVLLDLDSEANLPTWYASIQWFCVATLLGIFAQCNFRLTQRTSWPLAIFPLVFLALSLDEVAHIHETLGKMSDIFLPGASRKNTLFFKTGIWMFVYGVPFLGLFVTLVFSIRAFFQRNSGSLVKLLLGMSITLTGAVGVEILSNFVVPHSEYDVLQVFAEEMCEMLGSTIVLWGSYELLYRNGFAFRLDKVGTG